MGCAFISIIVPVYNEELYLDACVGWKRTKAAFPA